MLRISYPTVKICKLGKGYASHIFYIIMTILVIADEISYKKMLSIHNSNISV